jgi:hypothetical protein
LWIQLEFSRLSEGNQVESPGLSAWIKPNAPPEQPVPLRRLEHADHVHVQQFLGQHPHRSQQSPVAQRAASKRGTQLDSAIGHRPVFLTTT